MIFGWPMFNQFVHCQRAIRNERFKLIEYRVEGKQHSQRFDSLRERLKKNRTEGLKWEDAFWEQFKKK